MFLACLARPKETWGVAGPLPVIVGPKWGPDCFFWRVETPRDWCSAACFSTKREQSKQASWWFVEAPKRPPMGVRWPVPPQSGSRTNRPSGDDVWRLLRPPFRDFFWRVEIFWNWCSVICFFIKRKKWNKSIDD